MSDNSVLYVIGKIINETSGSISLLERVDLFGIKSRQQMGLL
ncbi:hypothetical protein AB6G19_16335 [Providencia manganoxydans]